MKPHLFKVLDKWLAFYRGDLAPAGFSAADTAADAYRMLVSGEYSVEYETPSVQAPPAKATVHFLKTGDAPRRPQRKRHRSTKSMCRSAGTWVPLQESCNR